MAPWDRQDWRDDLLGDTKIIDIPGVPGTMVVYGDATRPVLTGKNPSDVIMSAAQLDLGRLIIFSHDGFLPGFIDVKNDFYRNILRWVTLERNVNSIVINLDGVKDFPVVNVSDHVLVWNGADNKSAEFSDKLINFVQKGGGLVLGMCPWGYQQIYGGEIKDMPMYVVLDKIGVCYTDLYYEGPSPLPVTESKPQNAHFTDLLRACQTSLDILRENFSVITRGHYIPREFLKSIQPMIQAVIEQHYNKVESCVPKPGRPCTKGEDKALLVLYLCSLELRESPCKALGVEHFPGDLEQPYSLETAVVHVSSATDGFHATGYYLPAGVLTQVTVIEVKMTTASPGTGSSWHLRVGAHSDDITGLKEWRRWPKITSNVRLLPDSMSSVHSFFGGLLYLKSPPNGGSLKVRMTNVVQAPYYNAVDPGNVYEWKKCQKATASWADLVGEHIMLTLPTRSVRDVDPATALSVWDRVVSAHYELRGIDRLSKGRQWIVTDEQPVAGYMHAGIPIVTHMDMADPSNSLFFLNETNLVQKGNWGAFHEIGHNVQHPDWTFEGTGEVTCNIFTLHAMEVVCGMRVWIHPWLKDNLRDAKDYLDQGADFSKWKSKPGIALFVYAQLARDFGWASYKQVFRRYESLQDHARPRNFQDKVDRWIQFFSETVGYNIAPIYEFWGVPISDHCKVLLSKFVSYIPDDEFTRHAKDRKDKLAVTYPRCSMVCSDGKGSS